MAKLSEHEEFALENAGAIRKHQVRGNYYVMVPKSMRLSGEYKITQKAIEKLIGLGLIQRTDNELFPFTKL